MLVPPVESSSHSSINILGKPSTISAILLQERSRTATIQRDGCGKGREGSQHGTEPKEAPRYVSLCTFSEGGPWSSSLSLLFPLHCIITPGQGPLHVPHGWLLLLCLTAACQLPVCSLLSVLTPSQSHWWDELVVWQCHSQQQIVHVSSLLMTLCPLSPL